MLAFFPAIVITAFTACGAARIAIVMCSYSQIGRYL